MPFEILRGDIAEMTTDAIVNTANPRPVVGAGVDACIHRKAGPELLAARKQVGDIPVGQSRITPGFRLPARYVIHTCAPVWQGGTRTEREALFRCYESALNLAADSGCQSVSFPLLATGTNGFPREQALETAVTAIRCFLADREMRVVLVVFDRDSFRISQDLYDDVRSYVDENYVQVRLEEAYDGAEPLAEFRDRLYSESRSGTAPRRRRKGRRGARSAGSLPSGSAPATRQRPADRRRPSETRNPEAATIQPGILYAESAVAEAPLSLEEMLRSMDAGFSETLLQLIDARGMTDPQVYRRANVDRRLFSKIRSNPRYRPSKPTAVAFALALELDMDETQEFIAHAGYTLSHSSKFDIIVEYFIRQGNYDVYQLNEALFSYDQPILGGASE